MSQDMDPTTRELLNRTLDALEEATNELSSTKASLDKLETTITKLDHRVNGNGKEGLVLRVTRMEDTMARSQFWFRVFAGAVVAAIGTWFVTQIFTLVQRGAGQ